MKLGLRLKGIALLVSGLLLSTVLTPGQAGAEAGPKRPPVRFPKPGDWACVESNAPYYSYQIPVIFQDASSGTPRLIGWGYAEACVKSKSRRGKSYASIMEVHNLWKPDFLQRVQDVKDLVPLAKVLPEVEGTSNNGYALPIVNFTAESAREVYVDSKWVGEHCSRNVCPGIPPQLGEILTAAGFLSDTDKQGHWRWLIDSSRPIVAQLGTGVVAFFDADHYDPFYVHQSWFQSGNPGYGGVLRVMLNPTDLALQGIPPSVRVSPDGSAVIPAVVTNYSVHSWRTPLAWRYRGEAVWRPAESFRWRYRGETAWRPGTAPIELPAGKAQFGKDMVPGQAAIEVQLLGIQPGLEVELRINPDPVSPTPAEVAFGGVSDPKGDAYANNSGFTRLEGLAPNLTVHDIWYSPAPVYPGDRVGLSVAVRHDPTTGWTEPVDTQVVWYVNGQAVATTPVPGLKPGEDRRVNLPAAFTAPNAQRVVVRAVATPVDKETNVADNTAERQVPIEKPDLSIALQAPPEILADEGQVKVVVQVRNTGQRALKPEVRLNLNGRVVWSEAVPVPAGGQASRLVTVRLSSVGSAVTLVGEVDPRNAIPETNERNNRQTVTIPVRSEPPPADNGAWLIGG